MHSPSLGTEGSSTGLVTVESEGGEQSPRSHGAVSPDAEQGQLGKYDQICPKSVLNPSTNSALDTGQTSARPKPDHSGTQNKPPTSTPAINHTPSSATKGGGEIESKKELSQATHWHKHTGDPPHQWQGGKHRCTPSKLPLLQ